MSTIEPITLEPRRFSVRLPRPLWIGVAAVVLILVAVRLGIGTPIYRQHVTIREIQRRGGTVLSRETCPTFIRKWLGDGWARSLDTVVEVQLPERPVTDEALTYIGQFHGLRYLSLENTQITDAGLLTLSGLREIEHLDLEGTQVTDAGLEGLLGFTKLEYLNLGRTRITDSGLARLKSLGLRDLAILELGGAKITDEGLKHLCFLPKVFRIDLNDTAITDQGLRHLQSMPSLSFLDLAGTRVTDAGLAYLKVHRIDWLDVAETQVSDAGIRELKSAGGRIRVWTERPHGALPLESE